VVFGPAGTLATMLQDTVHFEMSTINHSIASPAIWQQRGPAMRPWVWSPAPGPIGTLLPILKQIDQSVTEADMPAPVFLAAKAVFDKAAADGWEELDIACVHDQLSGESSPGELA
jgi:L-threonate 2-dehydrogenase